MMFAFKKHLTEYKIIESYELQAYNFTQRNDYYN